MVDTFGGVDVLVDIIGEARWGSVLEFTDEDWEWSIGTNLRQAFLLMQAAGKQMVAQGTGGAMAFVASVDAMFAATNHLAYGAAKAGLLSLVKTFAQELGPERIRVNAVLPGAVGIETVDEPEPTYGGPMQPLRHPDKDDIAKALTFFVSDLSSAVTGQALPVDGGASIKTPWGGGATTPAPPADSAQLTHRIRRHRPRPRHPTTLRHPRDPRTGQESPMKLDLLYEVQAPKPWPDKPYPYNQREAEQAAWFEAIEQIKLADTLGFGTVWVVEHHFRIERSHMPTNDVFLAALSQVTNDIRLGFGVTLTPHKFATRCTPPRRSRPSTC